MIYDTKTKNKSFLKTSVDLRNRGVKNNKFHLILYDEAIQGLDPHSKDLTDEQQLRIYRECCINKWYFLREVARIPVAGKLEGIPYELHIGSLTISYLKSKNINQIDILPRQHGKTITEITDDVWCLNFSSTNTNMIYLNKEFKDSKEGLLRFKNIRLLLPLWMRQKYLDSKNDVDNQEQKVIGTRNNTLRALPAATSTDSADKLGRGLTTALIYFDEYAFLKFNQIIYEAALPAWKTAASNARENNVPYGITITTTPNNIDVDCGKYCKMVIDKSVKFIPEMFDMSDQELYTYIHENSLNEFVYVEYSYKELGKDDVWLQQMIRECQGNLAKVKREILLEWTKSTDNSVFSEEQLDELSKYLLEPVSRLKVGNYYVDFLETPDIQKNYIISCDVGGGLSQDSSAMTINDPEDFRVVGYFRNNRIDTESYKILIHDLATFYFQNALIIIESNSYGLNILSGLSRDPALEPRLLQEEQENEGEKKIQEGVIVRRKTKSFKYGVQTNIKSRKLMLEILPNIVDDEPDKIRCKPLYEEIKNLEIKKNGKIEHADGMHDDLLMSYLFFRYSLLHGKYLKNHGINAIASVSNVKSGKINEGILRLQQILDRSNTEEFTADEIRESNEKDSDIQSNNGSLLDLMFS